MNNLSSVVAHLNADYCVESDQIIRLMFVDGLCYFVLHISGLRRLVNVCDKYDLYGNIIIES